MAFVMYTSIIFDYGMKHTLYHNLFIIRHNNYLTNVKFLYFDSVSVLLFTKLTTLNIVLKMEFVVSKRDKTMLLFNGFKCMFSYTSQTNVTR
jgi:hypothetical protein